MISLITACFDSLKPFLEILFQSVLERTELIDEVVLPCGDKEEGYLEEWQVGRVKFVKFGSKQHVFNVGSPATICLDHAFNLHAGIDRAKNDFVLMSDPDIFFYGATDKFYMDLLEKYSLNYIGVSHPAAITQSFTYFPNILNCMGRKSEFPDKEFLKDKLYLDYVFPDECRGQHVSLAGKFLAPSPLPDLASEFPNPTGHYETGCNMVLWAKKQNWRWLSFQTGDCFNYTSQYYRGSVKVERLQRVKLIYHATNGSTKPENLRRFQEAYEASKEVIND